VHCYLDLEKGKRTKQKLAVSRLTDISKKKFFIFLFFKIQYIKMCSATFGQLLVLLGTSLTFQDTNMRKSVPPKERLAET
jgi:hypothetical protein